MTQLGRVLSGTPLSPVRAVGSGLSLSARPTCLKKGTAFVGAVCHFLARFICSSVGVCWPALKYFGRCPRLSNSASVLRPKRFTTFLTIDATDVDAVAGASESARIRASIQSRLVSNAITR
jgi:hypothetical protein